MFKYTYKAYWKVLQHLREYASDSVGWWL